ncbi:MAG: Type 1 glutamine amidotransferase-like domain-containing protein [Pseudomonadota bacterium]
MCDVFGASISSASELSIDQRIAAELPQVVSLIDSAEMIFIAGGNQSQYRERWQGTALAEALNRHLQSRPIAGTSAGMAILGSSYYAPQAQSLLSSEILNDPFHPNTSGLAHGDFLRHPALLRIITDTHLNREHGPDDEFRYARLFGLLARLRNAYPASPELIAIGAEEATFIAIDEQNTAQVFGTGAAYFLIANPDGPEQIDAQNPLIWNQGNRAARVFRIAGSITGNGPVTLGGWSLASGGDWFNWFTTGGLKGFNAING